jgi:hypothetical protein
MIGSRLSKSLATPAIAGTPGKGAESAGFSHAAARRLFVFAHLYPENGLVYADSHVFLGRSPG